MPSSYVTFTATQGQTTFSFAGIDDYLSTGFIKVYVNDVLQTTGYTLDTTGGNENVVFTSGRTAGETIRISRETPQTSAGFAANIIDFSDGSVLTATDLDRGLKGLLHIVQEANDTGSGALGKNAAGTAWDAKGLRITNGSSGIDALDFVTKTQLDQAQVFGGGVTFPQSWSFTGDGTDRTFSLTNPSPNATNADMFIVEVGGILQHPTTDYSISVDEITFAVGKAPPVGATVRVRNFGVSRSILDSLPAGSVVTANLQDGSVTEPKLATNAVSARALADDAVDTASIVNLAVTTAKIDNGAVTTGKIAPLAVTTAELGASAVTGAKIATGTITGSNIASSTITGGNMASNAISLTNLNTATSGSLFAGSSAFNRWLKISTTGALSVENTSTLPLGGTATGNLDLNNSYKVVNSQNPLNPQDAATKNYVDTKFGDASSTAKVAYYHPSTAAPDITDYPLGSVLIGWKYESNTPDISEVIVGGAVVVSYLALTRNQIIYPFVVASNDNYQIVVQTSSTVIIGSALTGTWVFRGVMNVQELSPSSYSAACLIQRVA